jgi:hypothetical protein
MAATVLKGNITTSDPVADEQVVDMRNESRVVGLV